MTGISYEHINFQDICSDEIEKNKICFPIIWNLPRPGVSAKRKCLWSSSSRSRGSQVGMNQKIHKKIYIFHLFFHFFPFSIHVAGGVAPPQAPPLPSKLPSIQSSWLIVHNFTEIDSESTHRPMQWRLLVISIEHVVSGYLPTGLVKKPLVNRWNRAAEFSHCFIKWNVAM